MRSEVHKSRASREFDAIEQAAIRRVARDERHPRRSRSPRRQRPEKREENANDSDFIAIPAISVQKEEASSGAPWHTRATLRIEDPLLLLHEEIIDFYDFIRPTEEEKALQREVVLKLEQVAKMIWPDAHIKVFGSVETGLWLPNSDIDAVVFTETEGDPRELINTYSEALLRKKIPAQLERILTARVPIIKMKDRETGIMLDISFNIENGLEGVNVVKSYLSKYPQLKYLITVIKYFLKQRGLNDTYSGGVGSFLLFCMVVCSVQQHPSYRQDKQNYHKYTLAHYFMHFLRMYGEVFNYDKIGISIDGDGMLFNKRAKGWDNPDRPGLICVECPQNPDNDLGRNSHGIELVKKAFTHAYKLMCAWNRGITRTPLQLLIRNDDILRFREIKKKSHRI